MQEVEWKHNDCVVTNAMGLYCISHHFTSKSIERKVESISKVIAGIPRDLIGNGCNDVEHRQERLESTGFIGYLSKCLVETVEHHQCRRAMRNLGCSGRFEAEESVRWWWLCRGMQPALKAWRPLGTAGLGLPVPVPAHQGIRCLHCLLLCLSRKHSSW